MTKKPLKSLLVALTAASVAFLGACSNDNPTDNSSPENTGAEATESTDASAEDTASDAASGEDNAAAGGGDLPDLTGQTLNVAAAWSGSEQENFELTLQKFEELTGAEVNYVSFGDNGPTYISGQLEGGNPPNVAMLAQPAFMNQLATEGSIVALNSDNEALVKENFGESWVDLGSVDGKLYGVWFKASNKSTMWYNVNIWEEAGATTPQDWEDFVAQLGKVRDAGYDGLSVGADVGWPLTDWFENIYLSLNGPEKYDQLANHEIPWTDDSVKQTLEVMAELWSSDLVQEGGAQRQFPESIKEVFNESPAAGTVYEGDFVAGVIAAETSSTVGQDAKFFDFPAAGDIQGVVGGGDVAVQFVDDEATNAFMKFMAMPESAEAWIPKGGLISPNQAADMDTYPDDISRQVAEALVDPETFRFDMSDLTPSAFGGTEGKGFWQEMISFYENPSDVEGTMQRLEEAAKQAYDN